MLAAILLPGPLHAAGASGASDCGHGAPRLGPHPRPRAGIDASRVLGAAALREHPGAAPAFELVRAIPRVADGIRCHCGCAEDPESYSLLSCFEGEGMAQHCLICQGQAKLAFSMHRKGRTLQQIRAAIDAQYE